MPSDNGLDELIEQITVDAYGDEGHWSFAAKVAWISALRAGGRARGEGARGAAGRAQVSEEFSVAGEGEPSVRHGVVSELARMASNGAALAGAVDRDADVDLIVGAAEERGTELIIQGPRDGGGDGPGEDGEIELVGDEERGSGCGSVVGMTGDAALVEDEQGVGVGSKRPDERREPGSGRGGEVAVGVSGNLDASDAQLLGGGGQLDCTEVAEGPLVGTERGSLPVGEAGEVDHRLVFGERRDDGAEPEGLVVGMRADGNDLVERRERVVVRARVGRRHWRWWR